MEILGIITKHKIHTKLIIITFELIVLCVPDEDDDVFHIYMMAEYQTLSQ